MINNPVAPALADASGLGTLIGNFVAVGIIIASIMVLLYLILGGIEWMSSGGDKAGLEAARNKITNALIGLAIVVSAWAIMSLVSTFLGLSFPCLPIPTLDGVKSTCATPGTGSGPTTPPPSGSCTTFKCQTDVGCRNHSPMCGKVCDYTKCVATCNAWSNPDGTKPGSDSSCYGHGESCNWTYTDRGAGKGICSDKY